MKTVGFTANSISRTTTYSYDRNGNRSSIVYDGGTKEEYAYDKDNRLTLLNNKRGDDTVISSYSYTYDLAGRIHTKTDSFGTTTYTYDADGRITEVEAPGKTSIYAYDQSGNRLSLNETYTSQQFSGYVDETANPQTNLNYLVKASEYIYSDANKLLKLVEKMYDGSNNEVVRKCTDYFYDANGNQTASSSAYMRVFNAGRGETFQMTSSDEVPKVTAEVPAESKPLDSGTGASFSISSDIGTAVDPLTQPVQAYKDNNSATAFSISGGNGAGGSNNYETVEETVSNQYDGFNRLKKSQIVKNGCNTAVEYAYNGDDLRVKKVVSRSDNANKPEISLFLYNGQHVILETDGGETVKARYVLGVNYVGRVDADDHVSYLLYNGHGDVVQTVATSGAIENQYEYDAFGTPTLTVEGYSCPIRYAGSYYDSETGLDYMHARYMDSSVGRFISEDSYWGESENPLSENLYTYCENDPIQKIDPTGHKASLTNMTSAQLNTYFHSTSGYAENNAIAQSYGYSSALAMVGAYATAETINSAHAGSTVTAQQVNYQVQSGSTAIYYAVNGSSPAIQAGAISAITHDIAIPNPSIVALQNSAAHATQHIQYVPQPVDQKELLDPTVKVYDLCNNEPYTVKLSEVGKSTGTYLWKSTPSQTERAIIAAELLGVNVNERFNGNTIAEIMRMLSENQLALSKGNSEYNKAMQIVLSKLGFSPSANGKFDNGYGAYMVGTTRAIVKMFPELNIANDDKLGFGVAKAIEQMLLYMAVDSEGERKAARDYRQATQLKFVQQYQDELEAAEIDPWEEGQRQQSLIKQQSGDQETGNSTSMSNTNNVEYLESLEDLTHHYGGDIVYKGRNRAGKGTKEIVIVRIKDSEYTFYWKDVGGPDRKEELYMDEYNGKPMISRKDFLEKVGLKTNYSDAPGMTLAIGPSFSGALGVQGMVSAQYVTDSKGNYGLMFTYGRGAGNITNENLNTKTLWPKICYSVSQSVGITNADDINRLNGDSLNMGATVYGNGADFVKSDTYIGINLNQGWGGIS